MPDGHCADPSLPLHLDQGRSSSKKESFSLRVSPALHPPERPSPRRVDMAGHGHGSGDAGTVCTAKERYCTLILITMRSHQSYHNITTVIHSYEYSTTVDNSVVQ